MPTGKLSVVGTPIGNLGDITLRALRTLEAADVISAEDTRRTATLLGHHHIKKPLLSYHSFNEAKRTPELLHRLSAGGHVAVTSDAGMPTLSDPGYRLIKAAISAGIPVEVIPGVSAITASLALSGIPADQFLFLGFLPYKSAQRRKALSAVAQLPYTLVFFESPHRLLQFLRDLQEVLGNRTITIARELTKKFEEIARGSVADLLAQFEKRSIKGEITIVVEGSTNA